MSTNIKYIHHIFGGGWATDFGVNFRGAPDASGRLVIPFLPEARNVVYELDGSVHKMPGTTALNASAMVSSSTPIYGFYDYWKQGTVGSPLQRRVAHAGTAIYADNADGIFSTIKTGVEAGKVPNYSTFDDLLIIASDSTADPPFSWDGTTFQNLAGTPPDFSFSVKHKNHHFAAGVVSNPSRLYYSATLDPEDWASASSGSIDIDPNDGDMIVGIMSWKDELWVFKGPNKMSIHRITGSSESDWARKTFTEGISAAWQNSIFTLPNDIGFVSPFGTIHSLVSVDRFGDYQQSALSFPINRELKRTVNPNYRRYWWADTDLANGYSLISLTLAGQTQNTRVLMMDYRFMGLGEPTPRWSYWDTFNVASIAQVVDTDKQIRLFAGGYDGKIWKLEQETRTHNAGAITMRAFTPFMNYGAEHLEKYAYSIGVQHVPENTNSFTLQWQRDGQATQSETMSQNAGDTLAPSSSQFTLDSSTLGGDRQSVVWRELETGGAFKSIQLGVVESNNNSDLQVSGLVLALEGAGVSTEN